MGEKHRFFDSIEGEDERQYTADEFAEYFRQFIRNGIFSGGENLKVETNEQDMKVFINPGYAWIEGYLYKIDTEPLVMEHKIADPSLNRIDRVVVRLDKTLENRYVKVFILEGTPAETPQVPELTRDNNIYEISLAQIEIIAGKSFIEAYQITDERLNNDVCGIATHLFEQVDTTDIFNEWMNYLDHKREEANLSYDAFVNAYQTTWNNWIEEKISEPGGEFYAEWKDWFNELQDTTNLVTKSQFDGFKNTKGVANGLASLDGEGNVPTEQLNNVQYLKDFYGRSVKRFNADWDQYLSLENDIQFDLFDYLSPENDRVYPLNSTIPGVDFKVLIADSNNRCFVREYPSIWLSTYAGAGSPRVCIASSKPYDLTDVDYIEYQYSTPRPNGVLLFGVQENLDTNIMTSGYDAYYRPTTIVGSYNSFESVLLDVRHLTGPYYLKCSNQCTVTDEWADLYLAGIKFIGSNLKFVRTNPRSLILNDGILNATIKTTMQIPPQFLDWYSLNALVDTPDGTSVEFAIYDNYGNLIKENVYNGEVFKGITAPIIQVRVTLSRESLETDSPTFWWLEMGYRGSTTGLWQKVDEKTLGANTTQLDIQVPGGFNEIIVIGRKLSVVSSTANLLMRFDENPSGYYYSYHYGNNTGKGYNGANSIELGYITLRSGANSSLDCVIKGLKEGSYPHGTFSAIISSSMDSSFGVFSRNDSSQINVLNLTLSGSSAIAAGATFEIWGR